MTKWQFTESNRVLSEVGCRKNGDETSVILWQMAKLHKQVSPCMFQKSPVIPLRASIDKKNILLTDEVRLHQFGAKVCPGTFIGHALNAGTDGLLTCLRRSRKL